MLYFFGLYDSDVGESSVLFRIVESVAYNELVFYLLSYVLGVVVYLSALGLVERVTVFTLFAPLFLR